MSLLAESIDRICNDRFETGQLQEKQTVLIRLTDRKFGISETDKEYILTIIDPVKLDAALDALITADKLDEVLSELK